MKTTIMWIFAAIGFFFGASKLGPTPTDNNLLGFMLMLVSFGAPMYATIKKIRARASLMRANLVASKALYEKSLYDLQLDPGSTAKHQDALARGREFYSMIHPNTYDFDRNGSASNFRDNSGIVEAKVQSDIQARIGKGKVS